MGDNKLICGLFIHIYHQLSFVFCFSFIKLGKIFYLHSTNLFKAIS